MRAYKGFTKTEDGKLMCRDMEYEVGKTYKHEGKIELCMCGFHACHELYQVWFFYPNNGNNVFYEVECGGKIIESDDGDGKFVCSEITLVKEVDMDNVALFDDAWEFSEGFAMVGFGDEYNFIDTEGRILSEQWFDDAGSFSEGFAAVGLNGKCNFIDTEGKLLSEQWFDYAWNFSKGFAMVRLGGKYNFISTEGKMLSELWFDDAWSFSEGFAKVEIDWKYNFISTEGRILSEQWFDDASNFFHGVGNVRIDREWKTIDTTGKILC